MSYYLGLVKQNIGNTFALENYHVMCLENITIHGKKKKTNEFSFNRIFNWCSVYFYRLGAVVKLKLREDEKHWFADLKRCPQFARLIYFINNNERFQRRVLWD